ncbi:MAG: FtsW/RodA/SpoVE family cell cycle protein [Bacteroidales bacterium]|nr:FtsW/RodA/SpoVE family cell cycle protein [Bacteroidales bacterium]
MATTNSAAPAGATELRDRKPIPKADKYIWAIYILLLLVSVVELYSASSREVQATNVFGPLLRHGRLLLIGVAITVGLSRVKYIWVYRCTLLFGALAVVLGIYVLFKGDIINGARRSTTILGIPLQPSEILKLAVVLFIAYIMSIKQTRKGVDTSAVIWSAGAVLLCGGLLFTQGLTNTLLLMGISFAMMLVGGVPWSKFGIMLLIYLAAGGCFYAIKHSGNKISQAEETTILETGRDASGNVTTLDRGNLQKGRIANWLGDSVPKYMKPITSANRQEMYSYMAQAHGGIHGVLPGNSRETSRLPLAFSDYIFAIVVEDWGFIGGMGLLILYLALLGRAGNIAAHCSRAFPALLVLGMAIMIVLQALFHMAIVTGVFPVSGQPLPLISKGGSSIIVTSIAFGIMLSVSRYAVQSNNSREINAEKLELPDELAAENRGKLI